ncbi:Signal transduction histidine kinase [Enhygromyxa salina]|uniref:histidine kinase n=1 Tax=Enhygromyxa salina TaxID=215803 RepID=A0A0C2CSV4_9BACT|nr:ATP-binding protein [Enhygromyxa salina]KIG14246.1 Signal transduction histidine kinase [Enhygromyxa salina]
MAPDAETSGVAMLSAELQVNLGTELKDGPGPPPRRPDTGPEAMRRRISYFMFFRLVLVALFALILTYTTWLAEQHTLTPGEWLGWTAVASGFVVTLVFAWQIRPQPGVRTSSKRLRAISWAQSAFDIVFAMIAVGLTGGVDSDLAFLFLIAVLGAATMGDRRQILAVATACGLLYVSLSMAQFVGVLSGLTGPGVGAVIEPAQLWVALLRNAGAIAVVAMLSSYLNTQLLSSVMQLGSLRTLNENIVRSLSSGLLTVDQSGIVLFANPTAAALLGRTGDLVGCDCEALLPGVRGHLDDSGGVRNRFELTVNRVNDNRRVNLGLACSTLLDAEGLFLGHIVNFQDVTDLREMERVLRRNERLTALGTLAASVAHEVRNPLAAISGCAELLEDDVGEEDQRLIRVIRSESARLADIVSELLDYTRPRELVRSNIELGRALVELADSFRADPTNASVELVVTVPKQPVPVELDISQLTQVLWNLVRNGAQAMDGEGRLELELEPRDDHVYLRVRDFGSGIEAAALGKIFEPFYSTKSGGTGIGLALVHRIVEEHGGVIKVESTVGKGTVFTVKLPRRAPTLS